MAVLVTGGAGYIGSHMVLRLLDARERVVAVDSLEAGNEWCVPPAARFVQGDVADRQVIIRALELAGEPVDAVLHFAGSVSLPESLAHPEKYYRNNTCATLALIEGCRAAGISNVIFSSTAAVYGEVGGRPVNEKTTTQPASPYGMSKLMSERMLSDIAGAHGLRCGVLRYFNVAGADPQGRAGHSTRGTASLIKVACEAALGLRDGLTIHGTDYPTRDGTAERDFIHVTDLVEAHYLALQKLRAGDAGFILNCGYGRGYTVLETISAVKRASGKDFAVRTGPRRPGDIASVIADNRQILARLGWTPAHDDIDMIAGHALAWERKLLQRSES